MNKNSLARWHGAAYWWPIVAAVVVSSIAGCGGGGTSLPSSALATPEATLETMRTAAVASDFDTFCECLSENAVYEMAGALRMAGQMMKAFAGFAAAMDPKAAEDSKKIDALMEKHVPEDAPTPNMMSLAADPEGSQTAIREAGKAVRDPKTFIAEFMKLFAQKDDSAVKDFKVLDVKVDGDTATATISGQDSPITLRRIDGLWKVDELGKFGMSGPTITPPEMPAVPDMPTMPAMPDKG
jgi:hypothetical protein